MKTTGYALREAVKLQELRRDTAARAFTGSLKAFPGEGKEAPQSVVEGFLKAESAIAKLQTAQARYNLTVTVTVEGQSITLSEAIKSIGGVARAEKMWRSAAGPKPDRYASFNEDEIDPSKVRAKATIAPMEAVKLAAVLAKRAGALRAAIATGNTRELEIENLDPSLFE
jgi:hypothetical protein